MKKKGLPISFGDDLLQGLNDLPVESIPAAMASLAAAQSMLAARLLTADNRNPSEPEAERLLDVNEAAAMTGMSADYLYRYADEFPFTVRVGKKERKALKFSLLGIHKWIATLSGK
jgi:predicted DNA-binding transcriptional regulator AlpA